MDWRYHVPVAHEKSPSGDAIHNRLKRVMNRRMYLSRAIFGLMAGGLVAGATGLEAQQVAQIVVESPVLTNGAPVPTDYTPDGKNLSPPLTWKNLPAGTKGIAVLCEDMGAGNPPPWVHWIVYNIPGTATGLPEGQPIEWEAPLTGELEGAVQGRNSWGRPYYRGPAPPAGPAHQYNFVVYALDAELDLPAGLNRAGLLEAIEGHVIGKGEVVPFYQRAAAR
jgi:Raf kinase inhibitor-like YbhB/YbcL family protein